MSGTLGPAPKGVPAANVVQCDPAFVHAAFELPDTILRSPIVCNDGGAYAALPLDLLDSDRTRRALFACDAREVLTRAIGTYKGERNERAVAEALLRIWQGQAERDARSARKYQGYTGPSCNARLSHFQSTLSRFPDKGGKFSKLTALADICEGAHARREKTLVFNEFWAPLNDLANELIRRDVPYVDLDGSTAQKWADAFARYSANDGVHVLLAYSGMFSCGVNLEATSHLVLAHRLRDDMRTQVVGRAQRPGRKGALSITELLYARE